MYADKKVDQASTTNRSDVYQYDIRYAWVPKRKVEATRKLMGRSGGGSSTKFIGRGKTVLQGFTLNYSHKDHHIDEVGVQIEGGHLKVSYNDKNDDDDFNWMVKYAFLKN